MRVGTFFGCILGVLFVLNLKAFITSIRYRKKAKLSNKRYLDVLLQNNKSLIYIKVISLLHLEWLLESRLMVALRYVLCVAIMLICVVLTVVLVLIYYSGYQELFDMRW